MDTNRAFKRNKDRHPKLRPGQDFVVRQESKKFPTVGVTLQSYGQDKPRPSVFKSQPVSASQSSSRNSVQPSPPLRAELPLPPVSASSRSAKPGRIKRVLHKITLKRSVITLVLIVVLIGGFLAVKFAYNAHKIFGGNIFNVLSSTKLKGEDTGRVNILLAGNSADDAGHQGGDLTDSIMIVSLDVKNHKAFLLSIPRDLWVNIPSQGHAKINTAYVDGQNNNFSENGFPSGGMGQLEQVVEQNFGININYYALIDYSAFRDAVNAVGGIDITVASSDPRGLYDPSIDYSTHGPLVRLTNGVHHLNGEQALDFARARGDAYGSYGFDNADFSRTEHQRQMLVALKSKAVSAGVITNPAKLSSLSDAIGNNVKTDFKLGEVHRLYDLTKDISGGNIQSISLNSAHGKNLLANYSSPDGESALIPAAGLDNFDDIQSFITQQTSTNPLVQESATIDVLNATNTSGLASRARTAITAKQLNVAAIGDALSVQATTTIIDNSKGALPASKAALQQLYGNVFTTVNPYTGTYNADFIVLIGADQVPKTTTTTTGNH